MTFEDWWAANYSTIDHRDILTVAELELHVKWAYQAASAEKDKVIAKMQVEIDARDDRIKALENLVTEGIAIIQTIREDLAKLNSYSNINQTKK